MLSNYENRLSVTKSMEFELSRDELWDLISPPGNLNHNHPFCKSNEVISWGEDNHIDKLVYLNGRS